MQSRGAAKCDKQNRKLDIIERSISNFPFTVKKIKITGKTSLRGGISRTAQIRKNNSENIIAHSISGSEVTTGENYREMCLPPSPKEEEKKSISAGENY